MQDLEIFNKEVFNFRVNEILSGIYDRIRTACSSAYGHSEYIYGEHFDDIFQEAVTSLIAYLGRLRDAKDENLQERMNERYFVSSIRRGFDMVVRNINRRREVRLNPSYQAMVKQEMLQSNYGSDHDIEYDVKDFMGKVRGGTKSFILMRKRDGARIKDINSKLGLRSMQHYYTVGDNVRVYLELNGFEEFE